jgi:murein DD-endopeptidase MepM/ murein hydrolase activator NlpD
MNYKAICLISSVVACAAMSSVRALELCGDIKQGEIVIGKAQEAQEVIFNGKKYPVTEDGLFILAFDRDEPAKNKLTVMYEDNEEQEIEFDITPTVWDIQKINGLPGKKVTPDSGNDEEILRERKDVKAAVTTMEVSDYWRKGFIMPLEGRISGNFGNQRILNGLKKNPHSGTDIAAPEGTPIKASASGKVILSGGNYFYSGNMVVIDPGQGFQSIYAHLKTTDVGAGDIVEQGEVIGTVGKTGRATGPHLHWGASLNDIRFRPESLLDEKKYKCTNF